MGGNTAALMAGYSFFGADHLLFASDYPYPGGAAQSFQALEGVIKSVQEMLISDGEKAGIFYKNARMLLKLP
jgi:predicted TIM-barrel fold metal-dependent hydrolase